ncbi:Nif3-like dinuclear metal center hexameric protein [Paenibacillus sp. CF384]|uniref:Nif3-like dinuclear metal center hexameric protein n=1 Tax=Paenibacillus sp. CF384 TaxID=1884382 RepID=UPI000899D02C|nr:Nif3-like dinuclear metal center hexameric protein [Paenibacillus sp. CF384]SDX98374.1 Putative GTP cyclohydrolase 1 type 2, NIF3 family [Paenibacillus sp. CF384]
MTLIVQDVLDVLGATAVGGTAGYGADQLLSGNTGQAVSGIVVTFIASQQVLEQAVSLGANLVISHEGIFYSHHHDGDKVASMVGTVHAAKKQLIADHGLAVYRFHDGLHRKQPDGIMEGLLQELGWEAFVVEHLPAASIVELPSHTGLEFAAHVKKRLGIESLRAVGDLSAQCRRVGLLAGYRGGGALAIPLFEQYQLDLILYGEGPEWETPEYVRDAVHIGVAKSLLVLGHLESEQPGMKLLANRLSRLFTAVPVHYVNVDPVFDVV